MHCATMTPFLFPATWKLSNVAAEILSSHYRALAVFINDEEVYSELRQDDCPRHPPPPRAVKERARFGL